MLGAVQQLEWVRETFMLKTPLRDWSHLLIASWFNLHSWLNAEAGNEYFDETHKRGAVLLTCIDRLMRDKSFPAAEPLPYGEADKLANLLQVFDESLRYELGRVPSYVLEEKRGYSVGTLIDKAYKTISVHNMPYLSEFTKQNIQEAGRCFVFDCFTATGFHVTRALEGAARRYFRLVLDREPSETRNGNIYPHGLGRITNELRDKLTSLKSDSKKQTLRERIGNLGIIIAFLEQICLVYRDALAHPDIIALDEDQAADVFYQCLNTISAMLNDVRAGGAHFAAVIDLSQLAGSF